MATGRNSAGINKAGGRNVNPVYKAVNTLTSYVGNVARELRDIPTGIGTSIVEKSPSEAIQQIKEGAAAITAGEKGTNAFTYKANGDIKMSKQRKSNKK